MIATDLNHITGQIAMTSALEKALDFLNHHRGRELLPGRIDIDGARVYASVQSYATIVTDTPKVEAHRRYIDLQFIGSGEELLGWAPLERMTVIQTYDEANDNCLVTFKSWGKNHLRHNNVV